MADEQLLAFLSRTPFFAALDPPALALVESMLHAVALPAGREVFHEGEQGNALYVVKTGTMLVYHQGLAGEPPVKLTRLGPGDFFGEMTLVEMQPRSATVVAESDAELLELRGADLYRLYKQDMKAYVLVLQNMNRELCRRLRRTNQRLVEWASGANDETTQVGLRPVR